MVSLHGSFLCVLMKVWHNGHELVEKAARDLPGLVAGALTAALREVRGKDFDAVTRAVKDAFSQTFLTFDAALLKGFDDALEQILTSGLYDRYTEEVLVYELWQEWKYGANRPALAIEGTTAVIGFIPTSFDHVWVASLGDSHSRWPLSSALSPSR